MTMNFSNEKNPYEDIIHLPHPVSKKHPRMDEMNRAAQFAPFAALTGYEDAIDEAKRITDAQIELDDNKRQMLDAKLQYITEMALCEDNSSIQVQFTYFIKDDQKEGGAYQRKRGVIKKVHLLERNILLQDGTIIPMDDIVDIECDSFDSFILE